MSANKRSIDPSIIAALIGVFGVVCVTIVTLYFNNYGPNATRQTPTPLPVATLTPVIPIPTLKPSALTNFPSDALINIGKLDNRLSTLEANSSSIPSSKSDVAKLNTRLQTLENVILENPAKALELSLLKTELDGLKAETQRTNNLYLGILGLMATLTIGVLSPRIGFRKKPESSESAEQRAIRELSEKISELTSRNERTEQKTNKELGEQISQLASNIELLRGQIASQKEQNEKLQTQLDQSNQQRRKPKIDK